MLMLSLVIGATISRFIKNLLNGRDMMRILRELFGPSKKEIWKALCEQTGSTFIDGGFLKGDKVIAQYRDWTITLDTYTVSTGKSSTTYTRIRAPYVNADGFRFTIYRNGIFSDLGEFLGFRDIEIGNDDFDREFVIKSECEDKVRGLLADPKIQELIREQPRFHLRVKDDEGWFGGAFPEGVDELYFRVPGIIRDMEQLRQLFELFSEILDRLCLIGSAYETAPEVGP